MPGWRRSLSVAALMLALLPAAAVAQSAGDEQYEDPFGDEQAQAPPPAAPAPAAQAPSAAAPAPAPATAPPAATTAQRAPVGSQATPAELPRSGADTGWAAGLGLVLLAAGVALRAHARRAP